MRDDEFVPSTATIAVGDVELVNEGSPAQLHHRGGQGVDVDVDPGTTTTQPVDLAAGTYTIFARSTARMACRAASPSRVIAHRTRVVVRLPGLPVGFTHR